jgi:hypothetical protein
LAMQFEKHILRHLLGQRWIVNDTLRNAEHHRLVLAHEQTKAFERSLRGATWNPATAPELNCYLHSARPFSQDGELIDSHKEQLFLTKKLRRKFS